MIRADTSLTDSPASDPGRGDADILVLTDADLACPIKAIGTLGGYYIIRDSAGADQQLQFTELCYPGTLITLCGDGGAWLRRYFPLTVLKVRGTAVNLGINGQAAADFFGALCIEHAGARLRHEDIAMLRRAMRAPPERPWFNRMPSRSASGFLNQPPRNTRRRSYSWEFDLLVIVIVASSFVGALFVCGAIGLPISPFGIGR